jgi:hypothetical protein
MAIVLRPIPWELEPVRGAIVGELGEASDADGGERSRRWYSDAGQFVGRAMAAFLP